MAIDTAKVDELNKQLSAVNLDIAKTQEKLDNLKDTRKVLESDIRIATSGRKKREK